MRSSGTLIDVTIDFDGNNLAITFFSEDDAASLIDGGEIEFSNLNWTPSSITLDSVTEDLVNTVGIEVAGVTADSFTLNIGQVEGALEIPDGEVITQQFTLVTIPEPNTFALLAGIAILTVTRRKIHARRIA